MKNKINRVIAFCIAFTIILSVFPVVAFAASFTIRRENIVDAYIQVDRGGGDWRNIEVREYRTDSGNPAYCIQHDVTGPGTGGNGYNEMNPYSQLNEYQQKGLTAILLHGYPYSNGGMSEEAARYVTGLAIRCWLTETGDPHHTYYKYLDRINYPERMRSTGGDTVGFLDQLLSYARNQDIIPPSITASGMNFVRSTAEPQYYVAQTTISGNNINSWSADFNNIPAGTVIEGNDGVVGRTLTLKVPISAANQTVSFDVAGYSNRSRSNIFFLSGGGIQNIVTPDPTTNQIVANTSASAAMPVGNLVIKKTNSETGAGLAGAVFNVTFAGQPQQFVDNGNGVYTFTVSGGTTDLKSPASGVITLQGIPGGGYSVIEKTAPSGYIGAGSQNVNVPNGGTGNATFKNTPTKVIISKTDKASGKPVAGVTLRLFKADGTTKIGDYTTDSKGKIEIKNLPAPATYKYKEIAAPEGYWFDKNKVYTFSIDANGKVTGEINIDNVFTEVTITKTDRNSGNPVEGVTIQLYNPNGAEQGKHTTNADGQFSIRGLAPGRYTYKELSAPEGYWFDPEKIYTFEIDANGKVTGETAIDNVYTEVTIIKVERYTAAPIGGVEVRLFNPDGTEHGLYTTDENGAITIKGSAPGHYTYKEVSAPPQYTFDPEKEYSFEIDENGQVTGTTEFDNDITQIVFEKSDAKTGAALDGIKFRIRLDVPEPEAPPTEPDDAESVEPEAPSTDGISDILSSDLLTHSAAPLPELLSTDLAGTLSTDQTEDEPDEAPAPAPEAPKKEYLKFSYDEGRHAYVFDAENGTEEFTTQEGKAILERIPKDKYVLEEVQELEGFTYTDPIYFTLDDTTNTETPLQLEMINAPTRIEFTKTVGSTDETIDGFSFKVTFLGSDYTNPEGVLSASGEREKITLIDGSVPITWNEDSETWEYDPASENVVFGTKDGKAIIDYLPKGQYKIVEMPHENADFLESKNLPFELNDTVNFFTPLGLDFENWKSYGTLRVYHRRVYTKEFLADPYYMTRPIDEDFGIDPDAEELKGLPIKMVEVYRTPRNMDMDKFPDLAAAQKGDVQLIEDYHLMTADELAEWTIANAKVTDEKKASFAGAGDQQEIQTGQTMKVDDFEVSGTYDDRITTIVYWYEKEDIPLTINNRPDMDMTTYTVNKDDVKVAQPKTGDTTNIIIWVCIAAACAAAIATVIIIQKRKTRKIN